MYDSDLQSKIMSYLSPLTATWSNELHRKLNVNKAHYTKIRNKMIEEGWIKAERYDGRIYLSRIDFEESKFNRKDWTKITLINCNTALTYLRSQKPIFRITKMKKVKINPKSKSGLDMLLHELDRLLIIHARLVYAQSLGLISSGRAKLYQNDCVIAFHKVMNDFLSDHEQFKNEISEYTQSQLKTVQFKI